MKTKYGIVEAAMRHWQIVLLIILLLITFGIYALYQMPRQEFPVVTIRQGLVIGLYPGATASQVEEQLTSKVEKYLFGFKEVKKKKTWSVSKEGLMIIFVELTDDVKNADEFWSKLNHGLSLQRAQLPSGVLALFSDSDFGDTSALLISLESDQASYRELETWLNKLEAKLRTLEPVSKIRQYGLQKEQITIYLEPEKLTSLGINSTALLANLFTQGLTTSSGTIRNHKMEIPVHISESYPGENEIAEQIIYSDPAGNIVRLKDVARIVREYPEPGSYILNNGKKCLLVSLEMQDGNNIVQFGNEVNNILTTFQKELPQGVVSDSVTTFLRELIFAIAAVILVTMLLLPFRAASVAATSIPVTIFISVGFMYLGGIELNTVTLAALIVVLGMIVDNSVVIVDSYMEKLDHGLSRWDSAITSAKGFFKAIFSATLAISITFFPFLFTLKGTFRDFVEFFPWTVTLTLGISLLVAMLVIPFLQYFFIRKGFLRKPSEKKQRRTMLELIQKTYEILLGWAFRHPPLTIGIALLSIVAGIVLFTQIPQRLMPIAERDQFAVEIYLPLGSALEQTALVCDSLEKIIKRDPRVRSVTSFIGTSSPRFHTTYAPNLPAKNYGQFIVNTASNKATEALLNKYSGEYAHYFPNAYVKFKQLDYQPVAAPVEVRLSGDDLGALQRSAVELSQKFREIRGISHVRTNFEEMLPGIFVNMDAIEANRLGINRTTVAANLAMHLDGLPVTTLWERDHPIPVVVKTEKGDSVAVAGIENDYIHSVIPGISVPLRQIATVAPDWNQGQIIRRNGIRTITVMADVSMDGIS
jgi:multidrug efflux pump